MVFYEVWKAQTLPAICFHLHLLVIMSRTPRMYTVFSRTFSWVCCLPSNILPSWKKSLSRESAGIGTSFWQKKLLREAEGWRMSISISILNKKPTAAAYSPSGAAEITWELTGNFPCKWCPVGKCSSQRGKCGDAGLVKPFAKSAGCCVRRIPCAPSVCATDC